MATITKRDLIVKISDQKGLTQKQVSDVIQCFIEEVTSDLSKNDAVVLRNFGTFHVIKTKPKIGRNPKHPDVDLQIPARAVVRFKPGKELKESVSRLLPDLGK